MSSKEQLPKVANLSELLEHSFLGTVLPHLLMNIYASIPTNIEGQSCEPALLSQLRKLTDITHQLRKVLAPYDTAHIDYLQHPQTTYRYGTKIVESNHPYNPHSHKDQTITIPGAKALEIHFDPKCCTESTNDYLQIFLGKAGENPITKLSGQSWKHFVLNGNTATFRFHTESQLTSAHRWGFRAIVKVKNIVFCTNS
jgi:hypothetical protein